MPSRATERINFGKIKEIIAPPNLIELQTNSYKEFLQADVAPTKRKNLGLQAVFPEVFPIESYEGKCVLDFHSFEIGYFFFSSRRRHTRWNCDWSSDVCSSIGRLRCPKTAAAQATHRATPHVDA